MNRPFRPARPCRRRWIFFGLLLLVVCLLVYAMRPTQASSAPTGILTFSAQADARVEKAYPNANYGRSSRLISDSSPHRESYLRFAVSGVSGTVESAKLRMYAYDGSVNGPAVYPVGNGWTETGVTWNTRPAHTGGTTDDKAKIPTRSWVEYDVTPLVEGDGTYSFNLSAGSTDGISSYSRESANALLRPQLVVTVSDDPPPVDTTPPEATIDSGPSGTVVSGSAAFAFASSESDSTFECSLNGGAFESCSSPKSYSNLSDGEHAFEVRATDAAGNTGPASKRVWTIDATAPAVSGVAPASGATDITASENVEAIFSEEMDAASVTGATFSLTAPGGEMPAVPATVVYDPAARKATLDPSSDLVSDTAYTAVIKGGAGGAKDAAGNALAADEAWSFTTADATPPDTVIDSGPSGAVASGAAEFSFSSTEPGSSFRCSLEGGAFSACTSPKSYSNLSDGEHAFAVEATDAAGNADPTPAGRAWTVAKISATVETDPVPHSGDAADDAAIWVNRRDPSSSTVIGADKQGGLAVYDLSGTEIQYLPVGRANSVDIRSDTDSEAGFTLGGERVSLVTASIRSSDSIGIYKVDADTGVLIDVAARVINPGINPYGSCMYRSPSTGKFHYFVNSKLGEVEQWELFDNGAGKVDAARVRSFDVGTQVEGCVADDQLGHLYIGEEDVGIWKYAAEPDAGTARTLVDSTGSTGHLVADVEGLTIAYGADGSGYLLASSQGNNSYVVYEREGGNGYVKTFEVEAGNGIDGVEETDGIDVTTTGLGPDFPSGVFVAHDGINDTGNQNFKLAPYQRVFP